MGLLDNGLISRSFESTLAFSRNDGVADVNQQSGIEPIDRGGWHPAAGTPLKFKGIVDLLAKFAADRIGHRKAYLEAVKGAFGADVDYAQLVKLYGPTIAAPSRYGPAECIGAKKVRVEGNPDIAAVSTSYVERQNLTMRMSMRRFTRLTNASSKKFDNHVHALSLYFVFYNF